MNNPLLNITGLPAFSRIQPEHVEPAIDTILATNRKQLEHLLDRLLAQPDTLNWESLVLPLEEMEETLSKAWSPVSHLNAVMNTPALRDAYNACLPKLSDYATEMGQNPHLYSAFKQIAESSAYQQLTPAQQKIVDNALRDFKLSGIELSGEQQQRYKETMQRLAELGAKFQQNLLDATNAWTKQIHSVDQLAGLHDTAIQLARQAAEQRQQEGWLLTLEAPSYLSVMTYADDRALRQEVYEAYVTRASDQGPYAGRWDNTPVMEEILALRHTSATLLGFDNFAERSLATKMAKDTSQVLDFLNRLAKKSLTVAKAELEELKQFARDKYHLAQLEAWDILYYSEKLKQHKHAISEQELKPYFPETRVIPGLFAIVEKLYGLKIQELESVDCWHPSVRFFEIYDANDELRGQFYLDLYARQHKQGGAWMDVCLSRKHVGGRTQYPVAYLTCNLTPPAGDDPALLTHNEVLTLFHEFGHGLHHMLTRVDYPSVSGINGVAWDAVELPSQFMENWCWEEESIQLISGHYHSGEKLPAELLKRLRAARNFQSGMQMVRQLEFAIFDFRLHLEYSPEQGARIYPLLDEVRKQVAVIEPPSFNRFPHSFSHIFAGGYAAGYYSYKWAEVLSADAFSVFEEHGLFDTNSGRRFLQSILEQGGARDPMELFIEFRGREPTIDALLRHSGLAA